MIITFLFCFRLSNAVLKKKKKIGFVFFNYLDLSAFHFANEPRKHRIFTRTSTSVALSCKINNIIWFGEGESFGGRGEEKEEERIFVINFNLYFTINKS